jgi:hypothetical protein
MDDNNEFVQGVEDEFEEDDEVDVNGLLRSWHSLQASGSEINANVVLSLAKSHHVTFGKWLAYSKSGPHCDHLWTTIATAIVEHRMELAKCAKISSLDGSGQHVVCVYNEDCTNEAQIYELEAQLRNIGVHTKLSYKPDAYTYVGIYRNNHWNIRPTLYSSDFNVVLGRSQIKKLFDNSLS